MVEVTTSAGKSKITVKRLTLKQRRAFISQRDKRRDVIRRTNIILKQKVAQGKFPKSVLRNVTSGPGGIAKTKTQIQAEVVKERVQVQKQIAKQTSDRAAFDRRQLRLKQTRATAEDIFLAQRKRATQSFPKLKKIPKFQKLREGVDIVRGGRGTESKINKAQARLNKEIEAFNKRFGNVSLTKSQFNKAASIQAELEQKAQQIELRRAALFSSKRFKISELLGSQRRPVKLSKKREAEFLRDPLKKIAKVKLQIKKAERSDSKLSKLRLIQLRNKQKNIQKTIDRVEAGFPTFVLTGEVPIVPAARIPKGITTVFFSGDQKVVNGKIITDIIFKTSRGQVGKARGIAVTQGDTGFSVIAGATGRVAIKFPSGRPKVIGIRSFVGREATKSKPIELKIQDTVDLLNNKKTIATVKVIKRNLKGLQQRGIGQIGTFKGKKIFRSKLLGKRKKKIQLDDFASISAVFNNEQLSLIIGKSITRSKQKSNFLGVIRGQKDISSISFSPGEKQQFQKALSKVVSSASTAIAKAERTGAIAKDIKVATASTLLRAPSVVTPKLITSAAIKAPTKAVVKQVQQNVNKLDRRIVGSQSRASKVQSLINKSNLKQKQISQQISKTKSKQKQKILQKQNNQQRSKQTTLQRQLQKQKLRQKLLLRQRTIQVQRLRPPRAPFPRVGRILLPPIPKISIKSKKKKEKKSKKVQAYNVVARPTKKRKGQKRPKLVRVNKVPLTKQKAKDLRNFILDRSLARAGGIKKTGGVPKKPVRKVPSGFAKRTSNKFRRTRTIKGKRVLLPQGRVIERSSRLLDTRSERLGITLRKKIRQISPKQRKANIKNLKKARAVKKRGRKR